VAHPILISGAGIAGLAAAIALTAKGFSVRVLEKRKEFSDAGAGIQIGPNGVKALAALGLREAVELRAFRPTALGIHSATTGRTLTRFGLNPATERRFCAPYLTLLRSDLQSVLHDAARAAPGVTIVTDFEVSAFDSKADDVTVSSPDGGRESGSVLIGADGLWSQIRLAQKNPVPVASGYAAFRALTPRTTVLDGPPTPFCAPDVGLWLSRSVHVVHYPVSLGELLNIVVIVKAPSGSYDWDQAGAPADLAPHLVGCAPALVAMLRSIPEWRRWSVFAQPCDGPWASGRTLRIGDAAHPMLPFLAQGAVMALEDAVVLGDTLADTPDDLLPALARFESLRRRRVARVVQASQRNGMIYHMSGPAGVARDFALRWLRPENLLIRFDWLYGYDVRRTE